VAVGDQPLPQRAWRAACPNCGAPVDFRSAASTSAVCGFCRSTLARDGEQLRRIGQVAELFDDFSPLQLGSTGRVQGQSFTLVGRLQLAYADGTWNEWHAWFDNGRSAWLSEDNGAYVLSFASPLQQPAPRLADLQVGGRLLLAGTTWEVSSRVSARLISAQGELPHAPPVSNDGFEVVELRNAQGEVASLDFNQPAAPVLSVGRSASLSDLSLQGLREVSEKNLQAQALNCPQCGATLETKLSATQSVSCHQCHALVDLTSGPGAALTSIEQTAQPPAGAGPRIPLGATGRLGLKRGLAQDWQVVGYLVREDIPEDGEPPTPWSEYLLFNRTEGFAFLVDTQEGWSLVRPLTGAPKVAGDHAKWENQAYEQGFTYTARVLWVEGEFYWRVRRDERALVTDYQGMGSAADLSMSREQTGNEVTWSAGRKLNSSEVAAAFKLSLPDRSLLRQDIKPVSSSSTGLGCATVVVLIIVVILLMLLLPRCSSDECDNTARAYGQGSAEHRQCLNNRGGGVGRVGGGSYGGYSSGGGGHK
jgi:Domain of unknown function (DUF4178)